MQANKYLIVIAGPTASGKTGLAIQLANHYKTAILSCDSRQFYREIAIGTAKPTPKELAAAPHHFVNSLSIHDNYTVGDYEREAIELLKKLYAEQNVVIISGGSGLFIRAICEGLDEFPEITVAARKAVQAIEAAEGLPGLQQKLAAVDPVYFKMVDQQNSRRLIRALEVSFSADEPFSSFLLKEKKPRFFTPIYICLNWDRPELYERINRRVDLMIDQGLETEAKSVFPLKHLRSLQTVGYKELFDYFEKENVDISEAIALIKQNSRRYAKRQLTWFRKSPDWTYFHPQQWKEILAFVEGEMG